MEDLDTSIAFFGRKSCQVGQMVTVFHFLDLSQVSVKQVMIDFPRHSLVPYFKWDNLGRAALY
jgi:hypothetical protein